LIALRPLERTDGAALQQFVRGLSPESRLHRFLVPVQELSPPVLHALTHPDQQRHVALAAVSDATIVGEGCYVALGNTGRAEFALAVADAWQRQGIGVRLLRALIAAARRTGLAALEGEILKLNIPMLEFAARAGFRLKSHPGDARLMFAELDLTAARLPA